MLLRFNFEVLEARATIAVLEAAIQNPPPLG
jgi:hypothetical protein